MTDDSNQTELIPHASDVRFSFSHADCNYIVYHIYFHNFIINFLRITDTNKLNQSVNCDDTTRWMKETIVFQLSYGPDVMGRKFT